MTSSCGSSLESCLKDINQAKLKHVLRLVNVMKLNSRHSTSCMIYSPYEVPFPLSFSCVQSRTSGNTIKQGHNNVDGPIIIRFRVSCADKMKMGCKIK